MLPTKQYTIELSMGDISDISNGLMKLYKFIKEREQDLHVCYGGSDLEWHSKSIAKLYRKFADMWITEANKHG